MQLECERKSHFHLFGAVQSGAQGGQSCIQCSRVVVIKTYDSVSFEVVNLEFLLSCPDMKILTVTKTVIKQVQTA